MEGLDQYSEVVQFGYTGAGTQDAGTFYWYSHESIGSKKQAKALLAINTAVSGVSFNAYSYGSPMSGVTNYFMFSENIYSGNTTGTQKWNTYSANNPLVTGGRPYSTIVMPDGSTNGVILQTTVTANGGIYQPFPAAINPVLERGKMYTASVWACLDTVGGYPSTGTMRISYYNGSSPVGGGSDSWFSKDFELTTTPRRLSFTFIANNFDNTTDENIAFSNGSGSPPALRIVLWGAQLCEGNTANNYISTSTEYNGIISQAQTGSTTIRSGAASGDSYNINRTPLHVPNQTSIVLPTAAFCISTNNLSTTAPPSTLSVYGLY